MQGPRPVFGYRWRDESKGAFDEDPITGPLVRRLFSEAAQGVSIGALARWLTSQGVPTSKSGWLWRTFTVGYILHNPAYVGEAVTRRTRRAKINGRIRNAPRDESEWIALPEGTIPPLVDLATFESVQAILRNNRLRASRNARYPERFLLRGGYVRCAACGSTMHGSRSGRTARASWYHRCGRQIENTTLCPDSRRVRAGELDQAVWERTQALILQPEIIEAELERRLAEDITSAELGELDRAIEAVERKQNNLSRRLTLLDDDHAAAPLVQELGRLGAERRRLAEERAAIVGRQEQAATGRAQLAELRDWCAELAGRVQRLTYAEKRIAMDAFNVQVEVYPRDHETPWELVARVPLGVSATCSTTCHQTHNRAAAAGPPRPARPRPDGRGRVRPA
jgi:hypothetical protein